MSNLPEYKILSWGDPGSLQEDVMRHLADGWELAGGVAHAIAPSDGFRVDPWWHSWSQAVVRHPTWQD